MTFHSKKRFKKDMQVPNLNPTLLGVHYFRAPSKRIASRRQAGLAELIIVFGGIYRARTDGTEGPSLVEAQAGDVVYWPANSARTEENEPARPTECIVIYFRWVDAPARLARIIHDSGNLIGLLALRILSLKEEPKMEPVPIWNAYLSAIFAEYMRQAVMIENPLVAKVGDFVERNLKRPFTLADLATGVSLNRHYFGRLFRKRAGMTPMEFVRRKRVEHALGMLGTHPSFTISKVCGQVGVPDPAQLRRLLKQYTGIGARAILGMVRRRQVEPFRWRIDPQSGAVNLR
jgi:AraC-like DNA-binding protein